MATRKTPEPTAPLTEELPPVPEVPCPTSADEVEFEIAITPRVAGGRVQWDWEILSNTLAQHVGDYSGMKSDKLVHDFRTYESAEMDVRDYVSRIRNAIDLKLSLPLARKIIL